MKLWMVIYILGEVGATIGPLPYGMGECQSRAIREEARIAPDFYSRTTDGRTVTKQDISYRCVISAARPGIENGDQEWLELK